MNKNCFPRSKHSAPKLHPLSTHIGKILLNLESFVWYRASELLQSATAASTCKGDCYC